MLSLIGGFLIFIAIITAVICLPIIILIGKTFFALKGNARQARSSASPRPESFRGGKAPGQSHDIIDTTCTVISEEAV